MTRWNYDDVAGTVIGGNTPPVGWKLFYDGRPQQSHNKHYAETEYQAEIEGKQLIEALETEYQAEIEGKQLIEALETEYQRICYQDPALWEIRIYNNSKTN